MDTVKPEVQFWLDEFKLIKDVEFYVDDSGMIRNKRDECPICALVNAKLGTNYTNEAFTAARDCYGHTEGAMEIVGAADYWYHEYRHYLTQVLNIGSA